MLCFININMVCMYVCMYVCIVSPWCVHRTCAICQCITSLWYCIAIISCIILWPVKIVTVAGWHNIRSEPWWAEYCRNIAGWHGSRTVRAAWLNMPLCSIWPQLLVYLELKPCRIDYSADSQLWQSQYCPIIYYEYLVHVDVCHCCSMQTQSERWLNYLYFSM